jgi:serine/threonine protein kinase/tetratricopeptide (TPR) repeat protein
MSKPKPRTESLFWSALALPSPEERARYLDQFCGGDQQLRGQVEELLAAYPKVAHFLESPACGPGATGEEQPVSERPGTVIGPYKLMEQIGEGGMGLVFVAEQTRPVRRKVALKVIKPGMDTRQVVARFEAERQALALMDHPNIARVLDGGETAGGRPYFVMELVKGVPITDFCDNNRLTPRQRLGLFVDVCSAVQHAHTKGIIHRDLKPSNVLVTSHDGTPVVKVIDFGVAKAVGQQLTDKTLYTQFMQLVGTPLYMSPEQAGLSGLDIDTRTDVYALGVLLYELLTGTTPFDSERLAKAGYDEIRRIIREEDPPRPSTRFSTLGRAAATVSVNRQSDPNRLRCLFRGELDWIVMRALEKDRSRRYESASSFAADVRRYLHDEPVQACPPSARYRLQKLIRRNKGRVAAAVALVLWLMVGVAAVLAVQAKADRDRAAAAADRAAREAWTTASIAAALRDARERADGAWDVADFPDCMQRATDAAVAVVRRADDFAAGGSPDEMTLAELAAARQVVDELDRHTRLITGHARNRQQFADELTGQNAAKARAEFCTRQGEVLRQFGLDPINGPADEVARAVAASRVRDALLGMLLEWHLHAAYLSEQRQKDPDRFSFPAADPVVKDRLGEVVRSARQSCGGAYARWQDLLDRKDVPGLVAFAASPDGLSFRASLVEALGWDLVNAKECAACRTFLRAAVDRYPHDASLHVALSWACMRMQPPDHAEALRHWSAASVLRPDSGLFHLWIGFTYTQLGAYEDALAAYGKAIALHPDSAIPYEWMGQTLSKKKDWEGAITAFREAIRLRPDNPATHRQLGTVLATAGRCAEALEVTLAALRQNPAWAEDPRNQLRYNAACFTMNCADGKGANAPPPAERPGYRKQALDFLTAERAAIGKLAEADRAFVSRKMQHWLVDKDLESVRDPVADGLLPPDERDAWNKLWADVRDLGDRTKD